MALTSRGQKTRELLYQTAQRLFHERGFESTTMRDIAKEAGVSTGSTYYYFPSKESLVFEFYHRSMGEAETEHHRICEETTSFQLRLESLLKYRLEILGRGRNFVKVLGRYTVDNEHPLSPFGEATKTVRKSGIKMIQEMIESSDLAIHDKLRPQLPHFIWTIQMATVLYWTLDDSPNQQNTDKLLSSLVPMFTHLLTLSSLNIPMMSGFIEQLLPIGNLMKDVLDPN